MGSTCLTFHRMYTCIPSLLLLLFVALEGLTSLSTPIECKRLETTRRLSTLLQPPLTKGKSPDKEIEDSLESPFTFSPTLLVVFLLIRSIIRLAFDMS